MTIIGRVVQQSEMFAVQSQRPEGGTIPKSNLIIKQLGSQYANQFVGSMFGSLAQCRFYPGDVVMADLRFGTYQSEDHVFQNVMITDIVKI